MQKLNFRKATPDDLSTIVQLLTDDDLGKNREAIGARLDKRYEQAFAKIDKDPNRCSLICFAKAKL